MDVKQTSRHEEYNFCMENFLSMKTLQVKKNLKKIKKEKKKRKKNSFFNDIANTFLHLLLMIIEKIDDL